MSHRVLTGLTKRITMSEYSLNIIRRGCVMKRKKRKEYITKERRQQILDAAREVFTERGFARATTAEIARTAGIAEGTIYNYFGSKRDLFTELVKSHILAEPLLEIRLLALILYY